MAGTSAGAKKAWLKRKRAAEAYPGPGRHPFHPSQRRRIALKAAVDPKTGRLKVTPTPKAVNMGIGIGGGDLKNASGKTYASRFVSRNKKAAKAMIAEAERRGHKDYKLADFGTYIALYFNPK